MRKPVPADRAFSRDVGILENARRFGYNALDSLIGFDDGYDTAGERAGKRIKGRIDAAIADPLGVTVGAMQGLMDTYDRVATPLTSEEIMAGKSPAALDALALASIPMTGVFGASRTADLVSANPRGPRAAPPQGGKQIDQPDRIFDPAQNRTLPVTPRRELTADERMAAAQALPTTFRLVRAPIGGQKSQGTSSQGDAVYDPVTGEARPAPQRRPADVYSMSAESVAGDPTKEWMEVPSEVLGAINMRPEQFSDTRSRLSRDGRTLYLASGPDTALFLQAWKQQAPFFNLPEMPNLQRPTALPNTSILGFPRLPGRPERSAPPNPERAVEGRRPFTPRPPRTFD